jgi:hypothetical protein
MPDKSQRWKTFRFLAACLLLIPAAHSDTASQATPFGAKLDIDIPHGTMKSEVKHYEFPISLQSNAGDQRTGDLTVNCSTSLHCQPLKQKVLFSKPQLKSLSVDLGEALNSAEIDLVMTVSDGSTLRAARPLNFGLWDSVESIGSDFPRELMGGNPESAHLWLEGPNGVKLSPTTLVHLAVTAKDGCAQVRTVKTEQKETSSNSGLWTTIDIPGWKNETIDTLSVEPNIWLNSFCTLEVDVESAGDRMTVASLKLNVKPNYWAALVFCLLGAFVQYVLAGMVQVVLATRANEKVSFLKVFVGSNGVEIIEPALKGIIAFVISYILNTTEIVQFKGADKSSLIGFVIFGFLIGFWQLKPLWEAIKKLSNPSANTSSAQGAAP